MNCSEAHILLHGLTDGELDLVTSVQVQEHLKQCPDCSQAYQQCQQVRGMITPDLYAKAPAALRQRLIASIRQTAPPQRGRLRVPWLPLAAAAMMAVVFGIAWITGYLGGISHQQLLATEVRASHVRSLMLNHLTDVLSSDQHTVKPWFNGKLDYSPVVVDLASDGFPLVGGRLDYLDSRPVAALVYRHRQHVVNLFTWPGQNPSEQPVKSSTQQGYRLYQWSQAGMIYWAVSDLNDEGMQEFVKLLRQQTASSPTTQAP